MLVSRGFGKLGVILTKGLNSIKFNTSIGSSIIVKFNLTIDNKVSFKCNAKVK